MKKIIIFAVVFLVLLVSFFALGRIRSKREPRSQVPAEPKTAVSSSKDSEIGIGDYEFSVSFNGISRKYLLHVPATYDKSKSTPLVLAFHGGMGSAEIMADHYGLKEKADKEGFIVAFPNGASRMESGNFATWNAGNCCGYATQSKSDDISFVGEVIKDIKSKLNIGKIFATGMSNGGMLAHRLACEMSDTFSAIAAVAGTNNFDGCSPKNPISIMQIHGLKDDHVLFEGGCGPKCVVGNETQFVSVPKTIADWVNTNGCDKNPKRVFENDGAYCDLYFGCKNGVQVKLCALKDGGHSWPGIKGSPNKLETSVPSQSINANDEIWNFFKTVL